MKILQATMEQLNIVYEYMCELENENLDKDRFSQIYQDNIKDSSIYYLLAFDESNMIGFASLHIQKLLHHCAKIGELQELFISKNHRDSGLGTVLFNRIKEIAVRNNCLQLEVCCNQAREKSHHFYLKQGMEKSHYKFTYILRS